MPSTFNLIYQPTAMECTPKSSGGHLGIYMPVWMVYALQLGSCSAVPLLCGGQAVQGASPYKMGSHTATDYRVLRNQCYNAEEALHTHNQK